MQSQVASKKRVADHGEVLTGQREAAALRWLLESSRAGHASPDDGADATDGYRLHCW